MPKFTLVSQSNCEIAFEGEQVDRFELLFKWNDENVFQLRGIVYALDSGGYAAEIRLLGPNAEPTCLAHEIELIDELDDVDKFFYVFHLCESMVAYARSHREIGDLGMRAKKLEKKYHAVLFPFLDRIRSRVTGNGINEKPHVSVSKSWFWNPFPSS